MMPHHGENQDQSELLKILKQQRDGTAQRQWPEGRVNGSDDGQIVFQITSDKDQGVIQLDFGKPVIWVGMNPQDAINLAQSLIQHARAISKEPIRIAIN